MNEKRFGVQLNLPVAICQNIEEAVKRGFTYRPPEYKAIEIQKVVIVKGGTASGSSTVDLILVDEQGQKHVVMLSAALLKTLPLGD